MALGWALWAARVTGGLYDPTVLDRLEAAGYRTSFEKIPAAERLPDPDPAIFGRWRLLRVHPLRPVVVLPRGLRVDLGGVGKAYAAERLAAELRRFGPCLVEAGGDVAVRGVPPGWPGWPVAVGTARGTVGVLWLQASVHEGDASQRRPVDLAPLLYGLVEEMTPLAAEAGLRLEVDVPPHLPEVLADPEQMVLVVRNLLDNAIKHTLEGGRVTVRASARDASVELVVADTGVGIPPEHLPRVFDRFYRVPTGGRRREGSGLGLALVREVVQAHGGEVAVRSAPGAGTEFRLRLPREPGSAR